MGKGSSSWEEFDECFDDRDGGALYVLDNRDGTYSAGGALWLDGGVDGNHYWAGVARYGKGGVSYGDVSVDDLHRSAEAFGACVDGDVEHEIGVYGTMAEAVEAVGRYVNG